MNKDAIAFWGVVVLGTAVTILAGVSAGFFLTTLMLVILTFLSVLICFIVDYLDNAGDGIAVAVICFSFIGNITMWATCFVATKPSFAWVGTLIHEGIMR